MMAQQIAIIDYNTGNIHSVMRALRAAAPEDHVYLAHTPEMVRSADRVVLPGQGAMSNCMNQLQHSGLLDAVYEAVRTKPLLGVCVGEQMLFERSHEGDVPALGILPGEVVKFRGELFAELPATSSVAAALVSEGTPRLKVPHMGWSSVEQMQDHPLWAGIAQGAYFYFVHSYYVQPADPSVVAAQSLYGLPFCCAVAKDNLFAVQFHPEKSADQGLQLYRNFVQWAI